MRRSSLLLAALLTVVAVAATGSAATAYVPERTPQRDLQAGARRMLLRPAARFTTAGVIVMRGGRIVFARNPDVPLSPASVIKLATTTAAMVRFGPRHRFSTRAFVERAGATVQDLYLVGGGDPSFATEAYRRARFLPKPTDRVHRPAFAGGSPTVEQLAARIARAGVRRIRGDIVGDESLFDTRRTQPGWLRSYTEFEPDSGYLTALSVNEGRGDPEGETLLQNPALSATRALLGALRRRGVRVDGSARLGRTPSGASQVARVASPPLAEIVDFVNRYSINFHAEVLLKGMGARYAGAGTTEAGLSIVEQVLRDLGVPLQGYRQTDGSGLSVLNRVTPRTVAVLLDKIVTGKGPGWPELRRSVAVAGRPGTLMNRMTSRPAAGNLRGKTGQIRRVRSMAGWVTGLDGSSVIYVAIFNNTPSPFALTGPLDAFGADLARFPRS